MRPARPIALRLGATVAVLTVGACTTPSAPSGEEPDLGSLDVELTQVAVGLELPIYVGSPIADPRLFVIEQPGRIRIIKDGNLLPEPFLDITDRVLYQGEQGLLGLAFDPDFRASGRFFVSYIGLDGSSRLEAYLDRDRGDQADPSTAALFLEVEQPFPNHNGGRIEFGPDNMLYVGFGDGGSAGDPRGHGQDANSLLGAILRLDILDQVAPPYRIPTDNPFVGDATKRPEIWQYGLRNPWGFSFDADAGWMYVADVGQDRWEEVSVTRTDEGGANFGWNIMEGVECFSTPGCSGEGLTFPAVVYGRTSGCSITGGRVYRGSVIPALRGKYVYSDFCAGWLKTFEIGSDGQARSPLELVLPDPAGQVTSIGADAQGELYVTTESGRVLRLVPAG